MRKYVEQLELANAETTDNTDIEAADLNINTVIIIHNYTISTPQKPNDQVNSGQSWLYTMIQIPNPGRDWSYYSAGALPVRAQRSTPWWIVVKKKRTNIELSIWNYRRAKSKKSTNCVNTTASAKQPTPSTFNIMYNCCITTWIELLSNFSAQSTYCDAIYCHPGAGFTKPCALLKLEFLTGAYKKCMRHSESPALERRKGFVKPVPDYVCYLV